MNTEKMPGASSQNSTSLEAAQKMMKRRHSVIWKKISELIKEGGLSTTAKLEFLDEAFEEYNIKNSGFDGLLDIFFEICQTKEEWEYLVKKT
ncbi:hypothetical protein [Methanosarcina barkeri]|uniref:hypothetical protein n=1 Tax=Methanosarcina barkeri TaxID=2208 RepID=UPI0006D1C74D|nr:hypothetical protein [Methanosarcina barkeri]